MTFNKFSKDLKDVCGIIGGEFEKGEKKAVCSKRIREKTGHGEISIELNKEHYALLREKPTINVFLYHKTDGKDFIIITNSKQHEMVGMGVPKKIYEKMNGIKIETEDGFEAFIRKEEKIPDEETTVIQIHKNGARVWDSYLWWKRKLW